jgi:hypothetical protein
MKTIDWNQASELGLVERINSEILHPLGLAMCRDVDTGASPSLLIADDGFWNYTDDHILKPVLTKEQIQEELKKAVK